MVSIIKLSAPYFDWRYFAILRFITSSLIESTLISAVSLSVNMPLTLVNVHLSMNPMKKFTMNNKIAPIKKPLKNFIFFILLS